MKRKLLLLLISLSLGLTVSAQDVFTWDGLLTTMEHPTDPAQGSVLAIMTNDAYHPIKIKADEYAKVTDPLLLSGKPIQLDSIYHFVCKQKGDAYSYDFEQLYKGAKYLTAEGWFVFEKMAPAEPGGKPVPGFYFYFLTKDGDKLFCYPFGVTHPSIDTGEYGTSSLLGGWTKRHYYTMNYDGTYEGSEPNILYSVRFIDLGLSKEDVKGYIPTQVLSSSPLATLFPVRVIAPSIKIMGQNLFVKTARPMRCITLTTAEGYTSSYEIDGLQEAILPLLSYANQLSVIRIEFADGTTPFTQKTLPL